MVGGADLPYYESIETVSNDSSEDDCVHIFLEKKCSLVLIRLELESGPPELRHLVPNFQFPCPATIGRPATEFKPQLWGVRYLSPKYHGSIPVSQGHCHSTHKEASYSRY